MDGVQFDGLFMRILFRIIFEILLGFDDWFYFCCKLRLSFGGFYYLSLLKFRFKSLN